MHISSWGENINFASFKFCFTLWMSIFSAPPPPPGFISRNPGHAQYSVNLESIPCQALPSLPLIINLKVKSFESKALVHLQPLLDPSLVYFIQMFAFSIIEKLLGELDIKDR